MITSKTGAVIDGKKVDREEFFNTLNSWGKDSVRDLLFYIIVYYLKVSMSKDLKLQCF